MNYNLVLKFNVLTKICWEHLTFAEVKPEFRKDSWKDRKIIGQSLFSLTFLKYMENIWKDEWKQTLGMSYLSICVNLKKYIKNNTKMERILWASW